MSGKISQNGQTDSEGVVPAHSITVRRESKFADSKWHYQSKFVLTNFYLKNKRHGNNSMPFVWFIISLYRAKMGGKIAQNEQTFPAGVTRSCTDVQREGKFDRNKKAI